MMTRAVVVLAIASLVAALAKAQAVPQSAAVRGVVADSAGHIIPFAMVELPAARQTTRTSEEGRFHIDSVPVGLQLARVRAVGYRPRELTIVVSPVSGWSGTIVLSPMPIELPEVRTTARYGKPPEYVYTTKYDDFFRRRRLGFGRFITREEMDRRAVTHFEQILYGIPGVRISYNNPGPGFGGSFSSVRMNRCPDLNVAVYWNGVRVYWQGAGLPRDLALGEYLSTVLTSGVEMVEVYHGMGSMPSDLDRTACGAIVIWTR